MSASCYHCNEPVLTGSQYQVNIFGIPQIMCCPGCQSIASTIIDSGLCSYYQYRTEPANKIDVVPEQLKALSLYDNNDIQQEFVTLQGENKKVTLSLDGVTCAACAWLIEKHLIAKSGVRQIVVNTTTHRAQLTWNAQQTKLSTLLESLHQLGYKAAPFEANLQEAQFKKNMRHHLYKLGIAGLASMQVMMLAIALYMDLFQGMEQEYKELFRYVSLIFATPVLLYSASPFYANAWKNLKARTLGMDVPVTLALLFAYFASCYATFTGSGDVYFESVSMFTFFLLLGRFLELNAKHKAAAANANLLTLMPKLARLTNGQFIAAKSLKIGMRVLVLPGESIPADGVIVQGDTSVNESMLTGESLPITKTKDDKVFAGTINVEGNIELEVCQEYHGSLLATIVQLQDDALLSKPKLVLVADKVAKVFVGAILLIASATWAFWAYQEHSHAFWIMLSVLVATCPCALSLATPTALTCATSAFSRLGLIVKQSHVFETLTNINHVVMDKTGTLTQGDIQIDSIEYFDENQEQALAIAAILERHSSHPIAKAFETLTYQGINLTQVSNQIGQGVKGVVNEQEWRIGSKDFALFAPKPQPESNCHIWLSCQGRAIAGFYLSDPLRQSSQPFINALKKHNLKLTMLTGDKSHNAIKISQKLGIEKAIFGVCPKQKMAFIKQLDSHHINMMIGDGVNDAPVLSSAHLSVAMGSGSDIAKSSADLVLLGDDLTKLILAQKLAIATKKIIKQNLAWSLGYNALILPLAVAGMVSPYIAVLGMSSSSVIVVVNSLRINNIKNIPT